MSDAQAHRGRRSHGAGGHRRRGGWKSLKVDGSSEEAFGQSLEEFKEKLSPARRYAF
jgi:hypothetical protein